MAAIYSNWGNRWNILGFNFTKRDALFSLYKISMDFTMLPCSLAQSSLAATAIYIHNLIKISRNVETNCLLYSELAIIIKQV
jgi:hypothetical protein